jgi:hypothetical protein
MQESLSSKLRMLISFFLSSTPLNTNSKRNLLKFSKFGIMVIGYELHTRPKFREIKMAALMLSLHVFNELT